MATRAEQMGDSPVEVVAARSGNDNVAPAGTDSCPAMDRGPSRKLIEADLGKAHSAAYRASLEARRSAEGQIGGARKAAELARSVGSVAAGVANGAREMVSALTDIRNSSSAISANVARVNAMTVTATEKTDLAERAVDELARVAQEINGVIELITVIAQQTTMLSHNANIQAARAGEEGRGFAVIATEVRKLSEDTRTATKTMQQQIAALQAASASCRSSVSTVADEIRQTARMCASIDASAHSQLAGVDQLSASAAERARDAEALSGQSRSLDEIATSSLASAERIAGQSSTTESALTRLHDSLFILMTQTRPHDSDDVDARHPILLRCALTLGGNSFIGDTLEFGLDGALLRINGIDERAEGTKGSCRIDSIGVLSAEVLRVDRMGVHVQFEPPSAAIVAATERVVREARATNAPLIERAVAGAIEISSAMEAALSQGLLSVEQLFDQRYQPVRGSNPQQFTNAALAILEQVLTAIQERIKESDKRMTFCCSVDLNGYLPVHNRIYSHPQRASDPAWNTANCRNKRIFDDRAGLAAARNTHPHLVQLYARDMGNGKFVMMKEIDAPIVVNGRHWGGFRTSYAL